MQLDRASRPRVLDLDLTGLERSAPDAVVTRAWSSSSPAVDRLGRWSGAALATALLFEQSGEAPLVIATGECVRRGVPTAARATIAGRAPLTGRLSQGQVGSGLARRLARVADAVVLRGSATQPGAVLAITGDGSIELHALPQLCGASPRDTHAALVERFGPCATLSIGVAGERAVALASLAAGGDPPHFVGRGGLGAVFGRLGLKALVCTAEPTPASQAPALIEALLASPRIEARAAGGTLELFGAFGARGELAARNYTEPVAREHALAIESDVSAARAERSGCVGCPTPCGWVFRRDGERAQPARFGASYAVGLNLGLERFDDALALLARCDELALDAKETGAVLALACRATELGLVDGPRWGERDALLAALDDLIAGRGLGARLRDGASTFARAVGLEREHTAAKGEALRPDASLASLLGQCVSSRGGDPMRAFPFLADGGGERARLAALTALPMPEGAEDPRSPRGKGRLVWWHENLMAALDATGFCAFSAAALIADGSASLDQLARWIGPGWLQGDPTFERSPSAALLAAGEASIALQRELDQRWAQARGGDRPQWARRWLDLPGMWDEYASLRGLDEHGALTAAARARFAACESTDARAVLAGEPAPAERAVEVGARRVGCVRTRSSGAPARELRLELPATVEVLLATLASGGRALPAVYRDGLRLGARDLVRDGDELDLVLVIAGG